MLSDTLVVISLFALFGIIHSVLASEQVKVIIKNGLPAFLPFYRITYNGFSLVTFYAAYMLAPKSGEVIYDLPYPWDLIILIPQILSFIGLLWCLKYIDGKEFLGISQLKRFYSGIYDFNELDERSVLRIEGPYRFSRHPIYLFSITFLAFRPVMTQFYLIFVICLTAYFYIGSVFEEKKLLRRFGNDYAEYRKKVSRIFPLRRGV